MWRIIQVTRTTTVLKGPPLIERDHSYTIESRLEILAYNSTIQSQIDRQLSDKYQEYLLRQADVAFPYLGCHYQEFGNVGNRRLVLVPVCIISTRLF